MEGIGHRQLLGSAGRHNRWQSAGGVEDGGGSAHAGGWQRGQQADLQVACTSWEPLRGIKHNKEDACRVGEVSRWWNSSCFSTVLLQPSCCHSHCPPCAGRGTATYSPCPPEYPHLVVCLPTTHRAVGKLGSRGRAPLSTRNAYACTWTTRGERSACDCLHTSASTDLQCMA